MGTPMNGLRDMKAILANERKVGGAVEAVFLRLCTGEKYRNACIVHIDQLGTHYYSVGFVTEQGERMIVNVHDISVISAPEHKKIRELNNAAYKREAINEKWRYLQRLFEIYEGSYTVHFWREAKMIIDDIGVDALSPELSLLVSNVQGQAARTA
ncbi:hypothetical protein RA955_07340 [Geobacillus proteiniphilus]|uniref:Phage protein n=1 Tax=Geobacillus proteiniphilus TaxID=860353 RepID=A0ABY9MIG7_9BACL|nr:MULTISPECIES: hypothetical protein [Geobacillus]MED4974232.1 hypothetical protein [Geobacillus thermoleovorans]OPX04110.1 hypothetical protein B1A75_05295 [Geobacillus sp. LEMMY01]QCK82259.1 hypothetical protein E5Z46_08365 [Geobacillus kaustophilus NBRC 102445]WMJ17832.1 hypothetical protein RA955_07340 [Geobacillus proteiniphilus]